MATCCVDYIHIISHLFGSACPQTRQTSRNPCPVINTSAMETCKKVYSASSAPAS